MEHSFRIVLISVLTVLCAAFLWQFINATLENRAIWASCNDHRGFSCDSVPQYVVGGFHFVSFIVLTLVIVTRRYLWLIVALTAYLSFHIYGTCARIGTGFFGGDMCPNGHPCMQAIRRASWFDWTATTILTIAQLLTLAFAVVTNRSTTKYQ